MSIVKASCPVDGIERPLTLAWSLNVAPPPAEGYGNHLMTLTLKDTRERIVFHGIIREAMNFTATRNQFARIMVSATVPPSDDVQLLSATEIGEAAPHAHYQYLDPSTGLEYPLLGAVIVTSTPSAPLVVVDTFEEVNSPYNMEVSNVVPFEVGDPGATNHWIATIQNLGPNPLLASTNTVPTEANSHIIQAGGDVWTIKRRAGSYSIWLLARTAAQVAPADTRISVEIY